ncbi:hypothetical protein LZ575_05455 [Antarcticibacterium sp. 1MA-6-2]|uniref:hypothetical protein n=1 Tax=Antarcticibacterium sp. 1MA-6-2 TaxID=2908210 RepID=UPI001F477411|nr:hypothetical protein [Antarcticibacterium sp. 1MA-6-2]UJH92052.1 hypothetical protein LZ575_05455 [Antarcticibacterium sp. 1MA-6-2]
MKTLVIFLFLGFSALITNAQGVIELNEARVDYNPVFTQVTHKGNTFTAQIKESYLGQFEKDPMAFMKENFNVNQLIAQTNNKDFDAYIVSFRSRKGELKVNYDKEGNIVNAYQRFKNVSLPQAVAQQLFRENKGWSMVKNVHVAFGRNGEVDKDFYRITMENGKDRKKVKLDTKEARELGVAGNF